MFKKVWKLYVNLSITAVFLSSPSLIINELAGLSGLSLSIVNVLIFMNSGLLFVLHSGSISLSESAKTILKFFLVIIIYLFFLWVALYEFNFSGPGTRSIIKVIVMLLFVFGIMNSSKFDLANFNRFFVNIAVVISFLSIVLYIGYYFGYLSVNWAEVEGHYPMIRGFGGYLNTTQDIYQTAVGISIRNQSYFTEPTNLGQFLSLPLFLSYQRYIRDKYLLSLCKCLIIATAYFLTFSAANFFGLLFALFIYFKFLSNENDFKKNLFFKKSLKFVLSILILISLYQLYEMINNQDFYTIMAKGGENIAFTERLDRNKIVLDEIIDNPFGDIEFQENFRSNPGAFGYILTVGGLPLVVIFIFFFYKFYKVIWKAAKNSSYPLIYVGAFAYLPPFLWDGQFSEHYFLFHIILFIVIVKNDFLKNKLT